MIPVKKDGRVKIKSFLNKNNIYMKEKIIVTTCGDGIGNKIGNTPGIGIS